MSAMHRPLIAVDHLTRTFRVPVWEAGLRAALGGVFRRHYREVEAVRDVAFTIRAGEVVGFLGPNGAGKTTTLKLLSGLLYPTAGTAWVAGYVPWERRPAYLRRIAMVMGNKSQLWWGLTPADAFRILGTIYRVPADDLTRTLDDLVALLEMGPLLAKPVRTLSLGERMKCELAGALLHRPQVLFLDEPTLGLDVAMQQRLRRFVADHNRRSGATVLLTSHYMADVQALCARVLIIHGGRLVFDGPLSDLAQRLAPYKLVKLTLEAAGASDDVRMDARASSGGKPTGLAVALAGLPGGVTVEDSEGAVVTLRVPRLAVAAVASTLLQRLPVADLAVEDPPIERVIETIYQAEVVPQ
jgi:ABC-2 type transport system ATP-binding protein